MIAAAIVALALWYAANAVVQVVRKPAELFFPVAGVLAKTPAETWRTYAPLFRAHATAVITPEVLAALAQTEGAGNPFARRGLKLAPGQRGGDHDVAAYLAKVNALKRVFARLAAEG